MLILAFDTALGACGVGVWRDGTVLAEDSAIMAQGHAEALMPMIQRVMGAASVTYDALDRIAVSVGPGSFTGLRVGIATARGLGMAAGKPAVGIATTEALAAGVTEKGARILSVIDSKRDDVFAQSFVDGEASSEILNIGYAPLAEKFSGSWVLVGDAAAKAARHFSAATISGAPTVATPAHLARLAATKPVDPRGPLPVYARAPDITASPSGGVLRP
jgi:tRNA threonylcarbamoyladenosine biosynthesis protein TsaB